MKELAMELWEKYGKNLFPKGAGELQKAIREGRVSEYAERAKNLDSVEKISIEAMLEKGYQITVFTVTEKSLNTEDTLITKEFECLHNGYYKDGNPKSSYSKVGGYFSTGTENIDISSLKISITTKYVKEGNLFDCEKE